jgi:hypothetical protein
MVHEMCRKFADEELAPNAGAWDKEHRFPKEAIDQLVRHVSAFLVNLYGRICPLLTHISLHNNLYR